METFEPAPWEIRLTGVTSALGSPGQTGMSGEMGMEMS